MVNVPASQSRLANYLHLAGMTILYYDHIITFGDEYWKIWRNLRSGGSWFFLLNRYFAFFANIGVIVGNFFPWGSEEVRPYIILECYIVISHISSIASCSHYTLFRQLVLLFSEVIISATLFLRIYALYSKDKRVLILVLSVTAVLAGFVCWSITGPKTDVSLVEGCHISLDRMKAIRTAVSWESLFIYDVLIVSLTLYKARQEREIRFLFKNNLFSLIVRDGATYFVVIAAANLVNTLTFYVLPPALRGTLSTLATNMSITMMSRLMFNLRQGASLREHNYDTTLPASALRFQHRWGAASSETDEDLETLPTAQYDTQPPECGECSSLGRTRTEVDIELTPLPTIEEAVRGQRDH